MNTKKEKLENARNVLKTEYIGIDEVIDHLIQSVTPWYLTPEILDRPLVISLWGITGTGKTSIVKRLLELLNINKIVLFDSGEFDDSRDDTIGYRIIDSLSLQEVESSEMWEDTVFVFDEFQHARTIDEAGNEISKPGLRQMWNLIDNGKLVYTSSTYYSRIIMSFIEDMEGFINFNPGIKVDRLKINDPENIKALLDFMGLIWFEDRTVSSEENYEYTVDTEKPLKVIPPEVLRGLARYKGFSNKDILECKTLEEVLEYIKGINSVSVSQKIFDFSKSLVFLIGNLDEAFYGSKNIDSDLNADLFKRDIDKVTISGIKVALLSRFRAEQVARFGNTLIKYPAFSSQNYKDIIKSFLDSTLARFKEHSGKTVTYTEDIINLVYSEGVFPAQGCRPVFSTINGIITPLLSSTLIDFSEESSVEIGVVNPESGYRVDVKNIQIQSRESWKRIEYPVTMTLGATRNPENNPLRYAIGVHEAGHAVVYAYCTGNIPLEIVSTSANGGGYTERSASQNSIQMRMTKKGLSSDIKVYLAGIVAEEVIFGTENITLGAGEDLKLAYESFCSAAYKKGYFKPYRVANPGVTPRTDGNTLGFDSTQIDNQMRFEMATFLQEVRNIVLNNRKLILSLGRKAAEKGSVSEDQIYEEIRKFENSETGEYRLTTERIKRARETETIDYYRTVVLRETND